MGHVVIVDYGMGNLGSVANMFRRIGGEPILSSDPAVVAAAERLVLPGVGHFGAGMGELESRGLIPALHRARAAGTPILGICLGLQLMARRSDEGDTAGLGWIETDVRRLDTGGAVDGRGRALRVPHMGWNSVRWGAAAPVDDARFYFVHSYCLPADTPGATGFTRHGEEFASVVRAGNIAGVQFHPEKSHRYGMELLRGFLGGTW